ncbi:four-carbon acid sugar kinase family protein [Deinococcus sp. KSM4-11]|uniref:four-carbon acid sugar kinase family protein n=1 Tax=Deinococcus sp. KSM4-11 TaxID=2568654 RepID=UPI0010A3D8DB|nr:four-carbon acid sugar kinase family protein [Deinococcus sp. KSM4-11]THF85458.1 four-carbon acid sugar kinase family protein [Deinococcus sp. KSM4-11]
MSAPAGPLPLGVVADDITGAGDIGGLLAKHGYAVRIVAAEADWEVVASRLMEERTDALIIDTDSRLLAPHEAAARVRRATGALREAGIHTFWKKTCSVFRGNVGAEFDALLDELSEIRAVAVAAFPRNGRTTVHGQHFVRGLALPQTEFAHDPFHPRLDADLVRDLGRQTPHGVVGLALEAIRAGPEALTAELARLRDQGCRYILADAETQSDLQALARALAGARVFLGSSALAEELPPLWPPVAPLNPPDVSKVRHPRRAVLVAGSVMPQTRAQIAAFRASNGIEFVLDPEQALLAPAAAVNTLVRQACAVLLSDRPVLIRTPNESSDVVAVRAHGRALGLDAGEVSRRLSGVLAEAGAEAARRGASGRLIALGGDTSAALTRALGIAHTQVLRELEPGLPLTYAPDQRLLLVLKSGSFGSPDFLALALQALQQPISEHADQ